MISKENLINNIDSLPQEYFAEVFDFVEYLKQKKLKGISETVVLSEFSLSKEWNTPEEDKAWQNL